MDYGRSARLCCVGSGDMEQPPADISSVYGDIRKQTQNSSLRPLAPLRTLYVYTNSSKLSQTIGRMHKAHILNTRFSN